MESLHLQGIFASKHLKRCEQGMCHSSSAPDCSSVEQVSNASYQQEVGQTVCHGMYMHHGPVSYQIKKSQNVNNFTDEIKNNMNSKDKNLPLN